MTPKDKGIQLVNKFLKLTSKHSDMETAGLGAITVAKACATTAVDEIILSAPFEPVDTDWDEAGSSAQYWYPQKLEDSAKWWADVKHEIQKL